MYKANVTDDYNDTLSINITCTNFENGSEIIIPTLLLTIPGGILFFCLISLMVYTLVKPLLIKK